MDVVIIHFHLNRGGVTRVIESHVRGLATLAQPPRRVLIVYGGRGTDWDNSIADQLPFALQLIADRDLDYDDVQPSTSDELYRSVVTVLKTANCRPDSTVLHIHNHSLGKKAGLPDAVRRWAEDGWRLLLQIHDFAEDLRPTNYQHLMQQAGSVDALHQQLYPQANQIQYAVLNRRDHDLLRQAGIDPERLHRLPNAVDVSETASPPDATHARHKLRSNHDVPIDHKYFLYPVRPIRRKNLGEMLLWSAAVRDASFAVSLEPLNPLERSGYQAWRDCAERLHLSVVFEAGKHLSLDENYAAANGIVTTSLAEGFGLVFLEAALANRPLFGRDLPGITADFRETGMQFPGLSEVVRIPTDWIDVKSLKQLHRQQLQRLRDAFRLPRLDDHDLQNSVDSQFLRDAVDFGQLNSQMQEQVLQRVSQDVGAQQALRDRNPIMRDVDQANLQPLRSCIAGNCRALREHYSLEVMGGRLRDIYEIALAAKPQNVQPTPAIARSLLQCFVMPKRFCPIRLET